MRAIVSVDIEWGIGRDGRLAVRNREDMRRFRELTWGGTVVCGASTFATFPPGGLPGRRNVVLSSSSSLPGAEVARGVDEALSLVSSDDPDRVWLVGGASVYRQMLGFCDEVLVTRNYASGGADAFFPNLDRSDAWVLRLASPVFETDEGVPFRYLSYSRLA